MKKTITQSTNWLTSGLSEEELLAKKTLAIIAADIQLKRIEMGLDQKEFAKLLGVSQGMISRWESGTYNFTITTLVNICEKLGLSFKPEITSKEVEEAVAQKNVFTVFNFTNCRNDKYSDWTPDWSSYRNNDTAKAGAVA
jgi:transcriptional regulator with XRE-family HTH domain